MGNPTRIFSAGLAVCVLGHCHPRVVEAITKQAQTLLHVSNFYHTVPQTEVATFLSEHAFGGKVFFCNSGAEANEAALKIARKYSHDHHGESRTDIITTTNSFHGRTLGTIAATGQEKVRKGFEPILPGFTYVPYGDLGAMEQAMTEHTCAVLVEPIQGEGGIVIPPDGYLEGLRRMCDQRDVVLMFDEVQTGIGHTGHYFGYQHEGVAPDVMTLAKGLAGGLPIGAMMAKPHIAEVLGPGTHGSTFGGNPVSCSAALAVLRTIEDEHLLAARARGRSALRGRAQAITEKVRLHHRRAWSWADGGSRIGPARRAYGRESHGTGLSDQLHRR